MTVKHIEARAIHKRRNKVVKIMQNNKISIFPFYIRKSFFFKAVNSVDKKKYSSTTGESKKPSFKDVHHRTIFF